MKYKIGDKVKVKSLEWYNKNKDKSGCIQCCGIPFVPNMLKFCGCTMTINKIDNEFDNDVYYVEGNFCAWTDDMFEGLADYKENVTITLNGKDYNIDVEKAKELGVLKDRDTRCKSWEEFKKKYQYNTCFYFDNNTDNIEKSCDPYNVNDQLTKEEAIAISAFSKLLKLRRDWIGTWNPDWSHLECKRKYCIICRNNNIIIGSFDDVQHTFSFPTEEMAREFLECFRNLFEQCKMLI